MKKRTFLRTMFNTIFHENILAKAISALVNFCYEYNILGSKSLKYERNVPLTLVDAKRNIFFQSITGDKIDCQ